MKKAGIILGIHQSKCDNKVFVQDSSIFPPLREHGNFHLPCGSDEFKIFESDEPTEMEMLITFPDLETCGLSVRVEVENGPDLLFNLPGRFNDISFYSKLVKAVKIQCEGGTANSCRGSWDATIFLRDSNGVDGFCPVSHVSSQTYDYNLECGQLNKIFESEEAIEGLFSITLNPGGFFPELCNLSVNAELETNRSITFFIPNPNFITDVSGQNTISFYSTNLRRVTIECESGSGTGCVGRIVRRMVLREELSF